MKVNLSEVIEVHADDLADAIFKENGEDIAIALIAKIDNRYADMEFSEKLFSNLAKSIALEGVDACDMEGIVAQARKDFKC